MKILFWLNGSGGQRTERKVVNFPMISDESRIEFYRPEIENELEDWKYEIDCNSEYVRWGWTERFNEDTLEPIE